MTDRLKLSDPQYGSARCGLRGKGKEDRKACARPSVSGDGAKPEHSIIVLNDAGYDPQAQSGSCFALGREERIEDLVANLGRYPRPIIGNRHPQSTSASTPVGAGIGMQPYLPVLADGLNRIADQVGKDLPHLSRQANELSLEFHLFLELECQPTRSFARRAQSRCRELPRS